MLNSPLQGINSVEQLLALDHMEFLACLGVISLHPGGAQTTQQLLSKAKVKLGERILEIGCGTGWTTRVLIDAGAKVTIVDKSARMISAALKTCRQAGLPPPPYFETDAANLSELPSNYFDFALYECVFGFIQDKPKAVKEVVRVLRQDSGRIGIIDLHYVHPPPQSLVDKIKEILGVYIEPLKENEWLEIFSGFKNVCWEKGELTIPPIPTVDEVKNVMENSRLINELPEINVTVFEAIARKWIEAEEVFNENRQYLNYHIGIWKIGVE